MRKALRAAGPSAKLRPMNESEKAIAEAENAGFDLSLVDSNLALTVEQRMLHHDSALEFVQQLRKAGAVKYASVAPSAPTPR